MRPAVAMGGAEEPEYMSFTAADTLQLGGGSSLSLGGDLLSDSFRCSLNDSPRAEPLDLDLGDNFHTDDFPM